MLLHLGPLLPLGPVVTFVPSTGFQIANHGFVLSTVTDHDKWFSADSRITDLVLRQ